MVKNSDKLALLAKRKIELEHAVRNNLAQNVLSKRIENVRNAAIGVIKKYRAPFANISGAPGNEEWETQKRKWETLTDCEIIEICETWPANPNIQHVKL